MRTFVLIAALFAAACSPAEQATDAPADDALPVPPEIAAVVSDAMPGVVITSGASDGAGEYEVTGTLDGNEYEFDLLGPEGGWRVVEVQRDIAWGDAPQAVRDLVATSPNAFLPERVIESGQPGDGGIVYVLFAAGAPETPALEVRYFDGAAAVVPPAH